MVNLLGREGIDCYNELTQFLSSGKCGELEKNHITLRNSSQILVYGQAHLFFPLHLSPGGSLVYIQRWISC